ncbi:MAG: L17 family ribosomal protein [Candidatus Absconditabacterales bacterium]
MRHKENKLLELETGTKSRKLVIRNMLGNLIRNGKMTTTSKRAKVLKSEADSFFSRLIRMMNKYEEKDAKRECIRYVKSVLFGKEEGKKVIEKLLPKYKEGGQTSSFVSSYKIGHRIGDGAEKILIKLL